MTQHICVQHLAPKHSQIYPSCALAHHCQAASHFFIDLYKLEGACMRK